MSDQLDQTISALCCKFKHDRTRLMDIVNELQRTLGCVSTEAVDLLASELDTPRVEVESLVSFYAFLSDKPSGKVIIRLCGDVIDWMQGEHEVAAAFSEELGLKIGQCSQDGMFCLIETPCIGMSDQAPAALINDTVVTKLTPDRARQIVRELRKHGDPAKLVQQFGDGNNAHEAVRAMVVNNIRECGQVIFNQSDQTPGLGLRNALAMSPAEVIRAVKTARLRGRGGAGFPTGMKWEFTRESGITPRTVICNADEGEPGTFKDRVILTECADLLFEGMTIAGYAIGAEEGILYLRGEYAYLRPLLETMLQSRRGQSLLGSNVAGKSGFNFDIRIQMGAGAYVCGEETALISSCEGQRGDPKNRPPFPAQRGYLGRPTSVNNVETLCCVTRILEKGPGWFSQIGNGKSAGTKLLSISGDCKKPGVFELPFGITISQILEKVGALDAAAVQVGGPSGSMIGPKEFGRSICFEDLATGGSLMIFGPQRNLLQIAQRFLEFFVEESCGYCTPCRVGNVLLKDRLARINSGKDE